EAAVLRSAWSESTIRASVAPPWAVSLSTRAAILELAAAPEVGANVVNRMAVIAPMPRTIRMTTEKRLRRVMRVPLFVKLHGGWVHERKGTQDELKKGL